MRQPANDTEACAEGNYLAGAVVAVIIAAALVNGVVDIIKWMF